MKKNQVYFYIVPRGPIVGSNGREVESSNHRVTSDSDSWVPIEITELMNEYKEIFLEDIFDGLAPIRSISHCMDLILRASLPNKTQYILIPIESKELNRQVHKLL